MRRELAELFTGAANDQGVRAIYLTPKGPNFCSGGDLKTLQHIQGDPCVVHRRFRELGQ
jgi:2-(1,2-epoxy-1,2-dihydrophenyl)acetyl-CoA isomerase